MAILLYDLPSWVFAVVGAVLLAIGVIAFVCAAGEIDNDLDEQEDLIIRSIDDEFAGGVVRSFKVRSFQDGKPRW
jgi:hypothetical protein